MNKLDWKGVGQFVAVLVQIWTIIKGVVDETKVGLEILGWITSDGGEWFKNFLRELVVEYKKSLEHIINFDSVPTIPQGLMIASDSDQVRTRARGKRGLSAIKIQLHLDVRQANGMRINGYNLKHFLEGEEVLGAQLLDFYLKHLDLIPEDWNKNRRIFFWGTIYCGVRGSLHVRFLYWNGSRWVSDYFWLARVWDGNDPAAVSASSQV